MEDYAKGLIEEDASKLEFKVSAQGGSALGRESSKGKDELETLGVLKFAKAEPSKVQTKIKINVDVETQKLIAEAARKARESNKNTSLVKSTTKNTSTVSYGPAVSGSSAGSKVLATGKYMVNNGIVVRGSCWDFVNAVFKRAGVSKSTVYSSKERGPYASSSKIQPGDWLYYKNLSYHNIGHSAIFVRWTDYNNRKALMLSYAGGNKGVVARYKEYNISKTYGITRAK